MRQCESVTARSATTESAPAPDASAYTTRCRKLSAVEVHDDGERRRSGRAAVILLAVLFAAAAAYYVVAMPGMDHSSGSMPGMDDAAASGEVVALRPRDFAERVDDEDVFVANVHVPAGTRIQGTDVLIPYDAITGSGQLPADKDTPVLLYCETGRMSAEAARSLLAEGYEDVSHLDGGLAAWRLAGLPVEQGESSNGQ